MTHAPLRKRNFANGKMRNVITGLVVWHVEIKSSTDRGESGHPDLGSWPRDYPNFASFYDHVGRWRVSHGREGNKDSALSTLYWSSRRGRQSWLVPP